jgi:anti-sigma factor RsiW
VDHLSDEALERYSLGTLSKQKTIPLEEHLMVCAACRARLKETDDYVAAMRMALTLAGTANGAHAHGAAGSMGGA